MSEVRIKGVFDKDFKNGVPPLTPMTEGIKVMGHTGVESMSVNKEGELKVESREVGVQAGTIDFKIDIELYDKPHIEVTDGEIVVRFGKVNIGGKK